MGKVAKTVGKVATIGGALTGNPGLMKLGSTVSTVSNALSRPKQPSSETVSQPQAQSQASIEPEDQLMAGLARYIRRLGSEAPLYVQRYAPKVESGYRIQFNQRRNEDVTQQAKQRQQQTK
jgi:hypothetical protein